MLQEFQLASEGVNQAELAGKLFLKVLVFPLLNVLSTFSCLAYMTSLLGGQIIFYYHSFFCGSLCPLVNV